MQNNHIQRYAKNPIISISDVKPTKDNMEVVGVFNCGGVLYSGKIYLLCRVSEIIKPKSKDIISIPIMTNKGLTEISYNKNDINLNFSDSRSIRDDNNKILNLTSFSSLRLAISNDGYNFQIDEKPCISIDPITENWGIEDPRIAKIDNTFYITYSSVSQNGVGVSLATTKDFKKFNKLGMILPPTNKDTVIFPEKINNKFYLLHRPSPFDNLGNSDIWLAESNDLLHWGNHKHLCGSKEGNVWEALKIGAGSTPIKIDEGWLVFYHGVDKNERYCMGYLLLDKNNPSKILFRTKNPIMEPTMNYEKSGFFSETIFPCATIPTMNKIIMYYGAADNSICRADIEINKLRELRNE
jgi:predicted GH43/DUF377 family glycosyl hydrolase